MRIVKKVIHFSEVCEVFILSCLLTLRKYFVNNFYLWKHNLDCLWKQLYKHKTKVSWYALEMSFDKISCFDNKNECFLLNTFMVIILPLLWFLLRHTKCQTEFIKSKVFYHVMVFKDENQNEKDMRPFHKCSRKYLKYWRCPYHC